ncbi:hypothetical protein CALVIDRAFT_601826 [Calocera viscosa TUFC12733]|uniref:BTB domain-containing protein n=1 Tax=Calocera viscosa (strain TUFC12733) TaxID=1330018 RepID=A0A167HUG5_CALVF|nr:hypothetical protein CALVIDRAFT_601826 [Calocera viscosa TUFC12733]
MASPPLNALDQVGGLSIGDAGMVLESAVARHPTWYFSDGNVVLRIEDTLYNIHQSFLSKSTVFKHMFALPPSDGQEGGSDDKPVVLQELVQEFDHLLEFIYPSLDFSITSYSLDSLCMLLRLSDKYDFPDIRTHVITQLLTPHNQGLLSWQRSLDLGVRHNAPPLVVAGSIGVCLQAQALDADALHAIASAFPENEKVASLLHARERARDHLYAKAFSEHRTPSCNNGCTSLMRIAQHLKCVLKDASTAGTEKTFPAVVKRMFLKRESGPNSGNFMDIYNCAKCKEQADVLVERVLNTAALKELVQEMLPWCRAIKPLPRPATAGALLL